MKIVAVDTFLVAPRWCLARIRTDEGITGWGEPVVEGRAHTVAAAVAELADELLGTDPLTIERHWQRLTKGGFYSGGAILASAVAGIDQALWDIAGKAYGVGVHHLLGGPVRDRIRIYGHIGDADHPGLVDNAVAARDHGLTAVKLGAPRQAHVLDTPAALHRFVDAVAAVRQAVGDEVDIAVDLHGRLSVAAAIRLVRLLEPMVPLFVEEPTRPEFSDQLSRVVAASSVPIATGERLYSRWDFDPVLRSGIAVAQPDLSHAGGISEVRRIAAAAETADVALAPHCPLGPVALAACVQLGLAIPNLLIQEQGLRLQRPDGAQAPHYLLDPHAFGYADGYLTPPTGPGLGVDLDEAAVEAAARDAHRWRTPVWHRADGSRAEW